MNPVANKMGFTCNFYLVIVLIIFVATMWQFLLSFLNYLCDCVIDGMFVDRRHCWT